MAPKASVGDKGQVLLAVLCERKRSLGAEVRGFGNIRPALWDRPGRVGAQEDLQVVVLLDLPHWVSCRPPSSSSTDAKRSSVNISGHCL